MRRLTALLAAALLVSTAAAAPAQSPAEFYKVNDVTLLVAADVGGGYDAYARTLAPFLKRHIPGNPNVIVQNMPGAGGLRLANHMAAGVKADGTVIALPLSTVALNQLIRAGQVRYDAREFVWLGTVDAQTNLLAVSSAKTQVRSLDDAKQIVATIGATNPNSFLYQEPALMNALLGSKFKIVGGYKGVRDLNLALERGEIDGQVSPWSTWKSERQDWLKSGKVVPIIATGARTSDLANVPLLADLVKSPRDQSLVRLLDSSSILGRSLAAPKGTPANLVQALRAALAAAVKDAEFIAEMDKRQLPVQYRSGEELQAYVKTTVETPPDTVKSFLEMVAAK